MATDTISDRQLRMIHAHFRDVDRVTRLDEISLIVSRRVTTMTDLTRGEATLVIDRLLTEKAIVW